MKEFKQKVAVITGAASGFGLEFARYAATQQMRLVLVDVQADALERAHQEFAQRGLAVMSRVVDVRRAEDVQALADASFERFGAVDLLFNNAGVASGGLIWESSLKDWEWVLGVNLMGVVHGIRAFLPRMIAQGTPGHVVNTASAAGLLNAPLMGVYNVSKHAVVSLTETLHHDLRMSQSRINASVLCPAFVPTGIHESHRNRPSDLMNEAGPTASQKLAQQNSVKAVTSGKITAAQVAEQVFEAIRQEQFYIHTHPKILASVQLRMEDIVHSRNPSDPFTYKPSVGPKAG